MTYAVYVNRHERPLGVQPGPVPHRGRETAHEPSSHTQYDLALGPLITALHAPAVAAGLPTRAPGGHGKRLPERGQAGAVGGEVADLEGDPAAEQFGQRRRGALLGQELPDIQVEHDRGDPRPVLHRRPHPVRRRGAGGGPTPTVAGDELVLDDPHPKRWQVEHLTAFHPHLDSVGEVSAAARARPCRVPELGHGV